MFFFAFAGYSSHIGKQFVAYGRHSRKITHAYYRRPKAPTFSYKDFLAKRAAAAVAIKKAQEKKKAMQKKVAQKKAPAPKRRVVKNVPKPGAKKPLQKKLPTSKKTAEKASEEKEEEILHFNLIGEVDPKMLRYQECIQRGVDRVWRPPLGVPKGTECVALVAVDSAGKISQFKLIKSSKIIIYNLSIVKIGGILEFDRSLWGKSFEITFRQ